MTWALAPGHLGSSCSQRQISGRALPPLIRVILVRRVDALDDIWVTGLEGFSVCPVAIEWSSWLPGVPSCQATAIVPQAALQNAPTVAAATAIVFCGAYSVVPWQRLYFLPDPQGQSALRLTTGREPVERLRLGWGGNGCPGTAGPAGPDGVPGRGCTEFEESTMGPPSEP